MTTYSRPFTEEEQRLTILALIAIRPHLDEDERDTITGIIRSTWTETSDITL